MSNIATVDSTKDALSNLLSEVGSGKIQLPDFQRGWVWDDEHIKSLLASISLSYPIGAVMILGTGNDKVRFKPRPLEGVSVKTFVKPEKLILDGQQRLTSLFQALYSQQPVETTDIRGKSMKRWYYIDIRKAIDENAEREDAIIGLPDDRKLRNFRGEVIADYSTLEKECAAELFPMTLLSNTLAMMDWQLEYVNSKERKDRWVAFTDCVIKPIQQYQVPLIFLNKETPKEAVCQVFEKVNTGGVALTVFELLTATYAADDYKLRDDWSDREKSLRKHKVLQSVANTDFLQAISLLATYHKKQNLPDTAISCKRKDILRLDLDDYRAWAGPAVRGFEEAAKLLHEQNVFSSRDLPYRTQLVPLAALFAILDSQASKYEVRAKLIRWYWCGIFGELYGSAVETRFARDVSEVMLWIQGGELPSTITEANFSSARLLTLRSRNSAAYKGLHALLLHKGELDFRSGTGIGVDMYFDTKIDIHHIFPQDYCKQRGIDARRCDCIVNKTAISARTNRIIGGSAPSHYLARLQKQAGITEDKMDTILRSHSIDPDTLRSDDFESFFKTRFSTLLKCIEEAMGKPIIGGPTIKEEEVEAIKDYQEPEEE